MERIKGGPFIEISFSISDNKEIKFIVEYIFKNIEKCMTNFKFEENDYSISYESFISGTEYDDELTYHAFEMVFTAEIGRERKGILFINKVEDSTYVVNLAFYGSEWDAPEWNQIGIMICERNYFDNLFRKLYDCFRFSIGCIAYEEDVLSLWNCDEIWPNSKFSFQYLEAKEFIEIPYGIISIICNQEYLIKLSLSKKNIATERIGVNSVIVKVGKWQL